MGLFIVGATGVWRLALWRLATGRLASGVWRLASGVWRLASGVWRLATYPARIPPTQDTIFFRIPRFAPHPRRPAPLRRGAAAGRPGWRARVPWRRHHRYRARRPAGGHHPDETVLVVRRGVHGVVSAAIAGLSRGRLQPAAGKTARHHSSSPVAAGAASSRGSDSTVCACGRWGGPGTGYDPEGSAATRRSGAEFEARSRAHFEVRSSANGEAQAVTGDRTSQVSGVIG